MDEVNLLHFIGECKSVEIADNKMYFQQYHAERSDYHGDLGWWVIPNEDTMELIEEMVAEMEENGDSLDDYNDEELKDLISERMDDSGWNCGGNPTSHCSDYETVYFSIHDKDGNSIHNWSEEEKWIKRFEDKDNVTWIEVYPYRYGTYSGVYDMNKGEFTEFECDGDSSPCGGPDSSYALVPDKVITLIRDRFASIAKSA